MAVVAGGGKWWVAVRLPSVWTHFWREDDLFGEDASFLAGIS